MNCSEPANRETLAKWRVLKYCPNSWPKHFIQFYQKLLILPLVHSQVPVPEKKALKPFLAKFLVHTIPNPLKKWLQIKDMSKNTMLKKHSQMWMSTGKSAQQPDRYLTSFNIFVSSKPLQWWFRIFWTENYLFNTYGINNNTTQTILDYYRFPLYIVCQA